jgi:hypothetical protein
MYNARTGRGLFIGAFGSLLLLLANPLAGQRAPVLAPVPANGAMLNWETGVGKSYLIPAVEIPGFLTVLNLYDRKVYGTDVYGTTVKSTWDHIRRGRWESDDDPFNINQFSHPYQGATMFGIARSTGVSFWQSWLYSNAGSLMWEMAGETGPPGLQDSITTAQAGALLGESLFRMASLILEGGGPTPSPWREWGATVLMPALGFNRYVFGQRFKAVFPSHDPALFWRLRLGGSFSARVSDNSPASDVSRREAILDFEFAYGLPGKPGYTYDRPFDYFQFELASLASAHGHNFLENLLVRGLLWGKDYEIGDSYAGVFGVYGNYVYISPQIFRVSSTAVSLGTTGQWWLTHNLALQETVSGGIGFGAAGTNQILGQRDYHYGATPQGLLALRLIFGQRVMADLTGRAFYISGTGSDDVKGTETIMRGNAGLTFRFYGRNAIGLQYVESRRNAHYVRVPNRYQSVGTFSIVYTLLSDTHFGAVGSRDDEARGQRP